MTTKMIAPVDAVSAQVDGTDYIVEDGHIVVEIGDHVAELVKVGYVVTGTTVTVMDPPADEDKGGDDDKGGADLDGADELAGMNKAELTEYIELRDGKIPEGSKKADLLEIARALPKEG